MFNHWYYWIVSNVYNDLDQGNFDLYSLFYAIKSPSAAFVAYDIKIKLKLHRFGIIPCYIYCYMF